MWLIEVDCSVGNAGVFVRCLAGQAFSVYDWVEHHPVSSGYTHSSWCLRASSHAGVRGVCWLLDGSRHGASGNITHWLESVLGKQNWLAGLA